MVNENIKVSVCIPVFGVEKYIERCARSLFEQTMQEGIEFIFVNDCTPDRSIELLRQVLEEYPHRKEQVKILHHEKNRGLVAARKTGLAAACGDYIIHCDSDDWVDKDFYEKMYLKAVEEEADVVYCNFREFFANGHTSFTKIPHYASCELFLKDLLQGKMHCALWNKLFKRDIALDPTMQTPDDICLSEDYLRTAQMLLRCKRITQCNDTCYNYRRDRISSYTDPKSYKIEYFNGCCSLVGILENCLPEHLQNDLLYFKASTLFKAVKHALLPAGKFHDLWRKDHKKMLGCKSVPVAKRIILGGAFLSYYCMSRLCLLALHFQYILNKYKKERENNEI